MAKTTKSVKHNKFTNDVRLNILSHPCLKSQQDCLANWFKESNDPTFLKVRNAVLNTESQTEFEKILFNMQLKSEGLGVL